MLQPVTEVTNWFLAIQFSLSSFASHQLVTETTDLLSGAIAVLPLSYWFQRTRTDLASRQVTKFNGQPSLPVSLVTEYYGLQKIAVAKIAGYREMKWVF